MVGIVDGKVALVTGAGSGVGRAAAVRFAIEGARVAVADLSIEQATETVDEVRRMGGDALPFPADVGNSREVEALVNAVAHAFGRIDCAFNNAGIAPYQVGADLKLLHEWDETSFDRLLEVNLKGVWLCMKYEIMQMRTQGTLAAIVNTSSIAGLTGLAGSSAYSASKHGVVGLTKSAAAEYKGSGIRINTVCPGFIRTAMTDNIARLRGNSVDEPGVPAGQPNDVAELAVWLCSEKARFVTGSAFTVDGGRLADFK